MEPQKCILITGFGPFRDIKQNISWCAVEGLSKVWPDHWPPLVTREIPVAYSEVRRIVPKLWQELQPRLVVHVGVDSQGGMFHLEQCSHNAGYNKCDVNDMICEGESCLANPDRPVEDCIRTQLDLEVSLILIGLCDFLCQYARKALTLGQRILSNVELEVGLFAFLFQTERVGIALMRKMHEIFKDK